MFGREKSKAEPAPKAEPTPVAAAKAKPAPVVDKPVLTPGRVAMAERNRDNRDPKMREVSGFEDDEGLRRRREMNGSLNIIGASDPHAMSRTLAADASFAKIEQLRGGHALMQVLGITNGGGIRGIGGRLNGPTLGKPKDTDILGLRVTLKQANPRVLPEVFQAFSEHAEGLPAKLLGNPEFCELVSKQNRGPELLAYIKASAWRPGLELVLRDAKIAAFVQALNKPAVAPPPA